MFWWEWRRTLAFLCVLVATVVRHNRAEVSWEDVLRVNLQHSLHPASLFNPMYGWLFDKTGTLFNVRFFDASLSKSVPRHVENPQHELDKSNDAYVMQLIRMFPSSTGSLSHYVNHSSNLSFILLNSTNQKEVQADARVLFLGYLLAGALAPKRLDFEWHFSRQFITLQFAGGSIVTLKHSLAEDQAIFIRSLVAFFTDGTDAVEERGRSMEKRLLRSKPLLVHAYALRLLDTADHVTAYLQHCENYLQAVGIDPKGIALLSEDATLVNAFVPTLTSIVAVGSAFPFSAANVPLTNGFAHPFDRTTGRLVREKRFATCVELSILNLLQCALFDPQRHAASTEHLASNVSLAPAFAEFFAQYATARNVTAAAENDWSVVLQDLPPDAAIKADSLNNVRYLRTLAVNQHKVAYELDSGLCNVLAAINAVCGLGFDLDAALSGLLKGAPSSPAAEAKRAAEIGAFLQTFFARVASPAANLSVTVATLHVGRSPVHRNASDFYGVVKFVFAYAGSSENSIATATVELLLAAQHAELHFVGSTTKAEAPTNKSAFEGVLALSRRTSNAMFLLEAYANILLRSARFSHLRSDASDDGLRVAYMTAGALASHSQIGRSMDVVLEFAMGATRNAVSEAAWNIVAYHLIRVPHNDNSLAPIYNPFNFLAMRRLQLADDGGGGGDEAHASDASEVAALLSVTQQYANAFDAVWAAMDSDGRLEAFLAQSRSFFTPFTLPKVVSFVELNSTLPFAFFEALIERVDFTIEQFGRIFTARPNDFRIVFADLLTGSRFRRISRLAIGSGDAALIRSAFGTLLEHFLLEWDIRQSMRSFHDVLQRILAMDDGEERIKRLSSDQRNVCLAAMAECGSLSDVKRLLAIGAVPTLNAVIQAQFNRHPSCAAFENLEALLSVADAAGHSAAFFAEVCRSFARRNTLTAAYLWASRGFSVEDSTLVSPLFHAIIDCLAAADSVEATSPKVADGTLHDFAFYLVRKGAVFSSQSVRQLGGGSKPNFARLFAFFDVLRSDRCPRDINGALLWQQMFAEYAKTARFSLQAYESSVYRSHLTLRSTWFVLQDAAERGDFDRIVSTFQAGVDPSLYEFEVVFDVLRSALSDDAKFDVVNFLLMHAMSVGIRRVPEKILGRALRLFKGTPNEVRLVLLLTEKAPEGIDVLLLDAPALDEYLRILLMASHAQFAKQHSAALQRSDYPMEGCIKMYAAALDANRMDVFDALLRRGTWRFAALEEIYCLFLEAYPVAEFMCRRILEKLFEAARLNNFRFDMTAEHLLDTTLYRTSRVAKPAKKALLQFFVKLYVKFSGKSKRIVEINLDDLLDNSTKGFRLGIE